MRILLIHNYYQYRGGEDVYFDSLTKLLRDNGHNVYTYTKNSNDIKSLKDKISTAFGMFWNRKVEEELSKIIKIFKPNVAHFNNIYPLINPTAYKICKKFGLSVVQTIHTYRHLCPKGILFRDGKMCELCINKQFKYPSILYRCYHQLRIASIIFSTAFFYHNPKNQLNLIDKFIFPAKFTRDYYIKNLSIPLIKTIVIPHFVNFTPQNTVVIPEEKNYFLYVGRLSEEKGIIQLIKLFTKLPKLKLIVIGDGPLRKSLFLFKKYKNIIFKGYVSEDKKFIYMKSALFTIIPSLTYEQGPLTLIESYSVGTPVIVPRFSTFKETVINKKTGIFYEFNNFEDLKIKLLKNYRDKEKAYIMGKEAKREYNRRYTSKLHYRVIIQTYQN